MIKHVKKDLFTVKGNAILVHAVNCQGAMEHGIAVGFKKMFPTAYERYHNECKFFGPKLRGDGVIYDRHPDVKDKRMGCLFTSINYGENKDTEAMILAATFNAVRSLAEQALYLPNWPIYSNKFNSGLFNVPWFKTEEKLKEALHPFDKITWIVCSDPTEVMP